MGVYKGENIINHSEDGKSLRLYFDSFKRDEELKRKLASVKVLYGMSVASSYLAKNKLTKNRLKELTKQNNLLI